MSGGYDLVISGGEVVDPGSGLSGKLDVAIAGGKIAAVAAGIDPGAAERIDATGQYVTPGRVDLPLMVHIGQGPPTIDDVIENLRPGDILTHCFTGHDMRIVGDDGLILPRMKDLHDRGLVLDIGHGAGSFSFKTARKMLDQG